MMSQPCLSVSWSQRGLVVAALLLAAVSCERREAGGPKDSTGPSDATSSPPAAADEIPIPDGSPQELFQFMLDLEKRELPPPAADQASAPDPAERATALRRVMTARVRVCDKILSSDAPPETRSSAVQMKLDSLRTLSALDADGLGRQFDAYVEELIAGPDPYLARVARSSRFQKHASDFLSSPGQDAQPLLTELQQLLADPEAGPECFSAARDAAGWMFQAGQLPTAVATFEQLGQRFRDHANAEMAAEARSLLSQMTDIQLREQARQVLDQKPDALPQLLERMRRLLDDPQPDSNRLAYAIQTAQLLEFAGERDAARQTYELILAKYQSDPTEAEGVRRTVELAERRLDLVGQPLTVEGVQLDGSVFDWSQYRGKHVIVCFWTTWDPNWPGDVSQLQEQVAAYADRLAVVTINLDENRNTLERFQQAQRSPWPVVVNADPTLRFEEHPIAVRCGVEAVPFALLVDAEGKVLDIHVLGDRLSKVLAQHLPPK